MKKSSKKFVLYYVLYFALYVIFAYLAMLPGYMSAVYWLLFPIVAAFLMAIPLTCAMSTIRKPGMTILLPALLFIFSKICGELKFACCWIPFLCCIFAAEILRDLIGVDQRVSIRIAVVVAMLSMAMWNNGFYFGGQAYRNAAVADMGEAYVSTAYSMNTAWMYIAVLLGVIIMSSISERIMEKFLKI